MELGDQLRSLEEKLMLSAVRADPAAVAALLDDDFLEIGSSGRLFDKAQIIEELRQETPRSAPLVSDFAVAWLSSEVALVTYKTSREAAGERVQTLRASVWIRRQGRWLVRFHQGTRVP